jgi:hypothetical protein
VKSVKTVRQNDVKDEESVLENDGEDEPLFEQRGGGGGEEEHNHTVGGVQFVLILAGVEQTQNGTK